MIKKIIEGMLVLLLVLFSFYYTDKAITILEQKDPIMKQIKNQQDKYRQKSINATINNNYMIPGYAGIEVDLDKSFQKMKQYGSYSDSLLVFKTSKPTISISDYYDKYISSGNGFTNNIALIFTVEKNDDIKEIKKILEEQNIRATFFVDGLWLDNNQEKVTELLKDFHEVEILSYDGGYDEMLFTSVVDKLNIMANTKSKYCYAEYDQKEVIDICEKEKLHTIIPSIKITNNGYNNIKGKIQGGQIISIKNNTNNIKELPIIINYIKQRGYTLDTLDNLLNEGRNIEK